IPMTSVGLRSEQLGESDATSARSVLIVDDDETLRARLAVALRQRGYEVMEAASHDDALGLARADSPEYAVVDLRLGTQSGLEVVRALKAIDAETKIVVLTGYGSI